MALNPAELQKSGTVAVSKYFRRDWQFIVDYLRTPVLKEASTAIAAAPAVLDFDFINQHVSAGVSKAITFTFVAAVTYICFYLFGYFSCPKFIREYRDFGEYAKRAHSNRFIGWELVNALRLTGDDKLVDELLEKRLIAQVDPTDTSKILAAGLPHETIGKYEIYGPNNVGVDLYVYFRTSGSMFTLYLKDSVIDPLDTSQRNLFWVIYTRLTKSRLGQRYITWMLFNLAIAVFVLSVLVSVYRAIR